MSILLECLQFALRSWWGVESLLVIKIESLKVISCLAGFCHLLLQLVSINMLFEHILQFELPA